MIHENQWREDFDRRNRNERWLGGAIIVALVVVAGLVHLICQ